MQLSRRNDIEMQDLSGLQLALNHDPGQAPPDSTNPPPPPPSEPEPEVAVDLGIVAEVCPRDLLARSKT